MLEMYPFSGSLNRFSVNRQSFCFLIIRVSLRILIAFKALNSIKVIFTRQNDCSNFDIVTSAMKSFSSIHFHDHVLYTTRKRPLSGD